MKKIMGMAQAIFGLIWISIVMILTAIGVSVTVIAWIIDKLKKRWR